MFKKTTKRFSISLLVLILFLSPLGYFRSVKADTFTPQTATSVYDDLTGNYGELGIASQFHIFAKGNTTLYSHTNGNIATANLIGNTNFGTNIKSDETEHVAVEYSYIQNITSINGSSEISDQAGRSTKFVLGNAVKTELVDNGNAVTANGTKLDHIKAASIYQDSATSTYIDFASEFSKLNTASTTIASQVASQIVESSDFSDMNNRVIDFSNAAATDQIFISIDADVLSASTPLKILNPNGAMLIFNVVGASDSLNINSKIEYGTRVNHETETFTDAKIMWNFGNSLKTLNVNAPFQGTVLAPEAAVTANQNLDGSIIATDVTIKAESHRWDLAPISITSKSIVDPSTSESTSSSSSLSSTQDSSTPQSSSSSSTQESSTPQSSSSSSTQESSTPQSSSSSGSIISVVGKSTMEIMEPF
ncbi:collagen-binding domain-containing protein [Lactococcus sp.]|uniref:collagen-binding domain-containing protein n=1 Tax=Lactococcus sp. TaxID=44273 RepID=UPI0035B221E5